MPVTYEPIATTTLGSAAASITFSSIAASYTDLRVIIPFFKETATSQTSVRVQFNSDTASNYGFMYISGDGSSVTTGNNNSDNYIYANFLTDATSTYPCLTTIDLFSYAGSTFKSVLCTGSADKNGSGSLERTAGMWRSTSAITSIALFSQIGNFAAGTTATLYGILKA
jgi:hypothetical protein